MQKLVLCTALCACTSSSQEASSVDLAVTTAAAPMAQTTTDLGYAIDLASVRIGVTQIEFTIEGEVHQKPGSPDTPKPDPAPVFHPGHSAGGEVTGELAGDHVLVWNGQPQPELGYAQLIVGDYRGANLAFRATTSADGLAADDPLLGHAFHLSGTVSKDGVTKNLDLVLDVEPDTRVVGAVFQDVIAAGSQEQLAIEFYPADPVEGDTAFDGVDFFSLSTTDSIQILPGSDAHNLIRREIQTHDHYGVLPQ